MIIENEIQIDAPLELVWEVTEDVEKWPNWTPTMTSVARLDNLPLGVGRAAEIKQPGQPLSTWVITEFEPGQKFAWESSRFGLYMKATHELSWDGKRTSNTLRVEMSGLLVTLLGGFIKGSVNKALAQENAGLKRHCETLASHC